MKRSTILLFTLFISFLTQAQYTDPGQDGTDTKPTLRLKPRIGLGVGTFTFFGDVGGDMAGYSVLSSDFGYHLRISNRLSPYFDLGLQTIFGTFTVNEINTDRRFNFKSQIRTGAIMLSYNFGHFLKADRFVEPWVSVGIESFEFLSKTDMYDAEGRMYHYWSDGTIRDLPESAPNAGDAVMLQRDYNYETDLRELNADGVGRYQDRNWSIPVGAGVNFRMTDRFEARLGATMHYTLTDLIDNVSDVGEGIRQGNSSNDRFMYFSLALNYDLSVTPKEKPEPLKFLDEDGNEITVDLDDWDKDGVSDWIDKCHATPEGAKVDKFGCPVDTDGDGFPDYMDAEPMTLAGAIVDPFGEAISDHDVEIRYLAWTDSIPWREYNGTTGFSEDFASVSFDPQRFPEDPSYTVQVGVNDDGLTQAEINAILSLVDVRSVTRGDKESYIVGRYDDLPEAVQRKMELEQQGINGRVKYDDGDKLIAMDAKALEVEGELLAAAGDSIPGVMGSDKKIYRVQLGAFRYKLNENIFQGIDDLVIIKGDDGITRYMSGAFDNPNMAALHKAKMLLEGFEGSFITAYQGGTRITLAYAGMTVSPDAEDLTIDKVNSSIKKELVQFRIQLGAYENQIPTDVLNKFLEVGQVKPRRDTDGLTKYLHGQFASMEEAEEALKVIKAKGVEDAFIIGDFNGKLIPADQAQKLITGDNDEVYIPLGN